MGSYSVHIRSLFSLRLQSSALTQKQCSSETSILFGSWTQSPTYVHKSEYKVVFHNYCPFLLRVGAAWLQLHVSPSIELLKTMPEHLNIHLTNAKSTEDTKRFSVDFTSFGSSPVRQFH